MSTLIHRRVEEARQGINPAVICRVTSGWVVLGDVQFWQGYSLLLPDPVVPSLSLQPSQKRSGGSQYGFTIGKVRLHSI